MTKQKKEIFLYFFLPSLRMLVPLAAAKPMSLTNEDFPFLFCIWLEPQFYVCMCVLVCVCVGGGGLGGGGACISVCVYS